jgi:hypothetical protein
MSDQDDFSAWQEKERKKAEEERRERIKRQEEERRTSTSADELISVSEQEPSAPEWGRLEPKPSPQEQAEVTPLVAPTPGTVIASTVTIDALFTSVFGTRSADLAATPIYSWNTGSSIIAQWPSVTDNYSCIVARFEARSLKGSSIAQ